MIDKEVGSKPPPLSKHSAEELSTVLQLERKLLLNAQENYRRLKSRFIEVSAENKRLKDEQDQVIRETEEEQDRLLAQVDDAKNYMQQLVDEVDEEKRDRHEQFETFKAKSLNEIQSIYRNQLEAVCVELTLTQEKCRKLAESNGGFEAEVAMLRREFGDMELAYRRRESEIHAAHDAELLAMSRELRDGQRFELNVAKLSEQLTAEQTRSSSLEQEKLVLVEQHSTRIGRKEAKIADLERRLAEADRKIMQMEVQHKSAHSEVRKLSERVSLQNDVETQLRTRISELEKQKIDSGSSRFAESSQRQKEISERIGRYEATIEILEHKLKVKDKQMHDTADELHQLRGIRSEAARLQATLRQSQQAFKRRVDELEAQKRSAEFDYEKTIQRLTWERDKAEQELADQKQISEHGEGPRIALLKEEIALRDQRILELKIHYRGLLSRMKRAIEKRNSIVTESQPGSHSVNGESSSRLVSESSNPRSHRHQRTSEANSQS